MGATQSSYKGGANLPPEILSMIGSYADPSDRTRMRRTGSAASAVPRDYLPSAEEFHAIQPYTGYSWSFQKIVDLVLQHDTSRNRKIYESVVSMDDTWRNCEAIVQGICYAVNALPVNYWGAFQLDEEKLNNFYPKFEWMLKTADQLTNGEMQQVLDEMSFSIGYQRTQREFIKRLKRLVFGTS